MQSSNTVRVCGVRICSILQQKNCELFATACRGHDQRGSVFLGCLVYICACGQQNPGRCEVSLLTGKQQRRETTVRTSPYIRSAVNQRPCNFRMFPGNCSHQSCLPLLHLL